MLALVACGFLTLSALATSSGAASPLPLRSSNDGVPAFGHVFEIVGENTSLSQITPTHAPYLTGTLKPQAAWLTNYHSLHHTSSLGDYIGLTSGQFTRCEANNDLPNHCNQDVPNLFQQLDATHLQWREWNESADNACDFVDHGAGWAKNIFSAHHSPSVYFTGISGGKYDEAIRPARECLKNDLPMGSTAPNDTSRFDHALTTGSVGRFNLVVPNDCENGHDRCGTKDPVKQFDSFLAREVPKIEASPAFGSNGLIVITWDEGADPPLGSHHPLTLAIGSQVNSGVYQGAYTHYGLLRTVEDGFGLAHLGAARNAKPINSIWN
jgi:hypothetical protein